MNILKLTFYIFNAPGNILKLVKENVKVNLGSSFELT